MGTRNLTCVSVNNEIKVAQYGQFDGYPSGQGSTILKFLKEANLNAFKEIVEQCEWITSEELDETWAEFGVGTDSRFVSYDVSKMYEEKYPHLDRRIAGGILEYLLTDGPQKLNNQEEFAKDGLFCEWAYVVDLDTNLLEVYTGFSKKFIPSRFAESPLLDQDGEQAKYQPIYLLKTFDIDDLPEEDEFCRILLEAHEEEYEKNKER